MATPSFLFGGSTNETPTSIKQKRDLVRALMGASNAPRNIGEGLNALGDGIVANVLDRRANEAESKGTSAANDLFNSIIGTGSSPSASSMPSTTGAGEQMDATSPAGGKPLDLSGNEVFGQFIDTVKTGVTNPFGLAAVAATGRAESGFSPKNVNRTWDDPSESGQPGRAGGIMSWRGPRYNALAATGDLSPVGQGKFFLQENPQLIKSLNAAKSVEEAQSLMNNAWAFRGYNRPGGEAARRLGYAQGFLPNFQGQGGGQEVASLDPAAGMPAAATPTERPPAPGYVDPMVSASNYNPTAPNPGAIPAAGVQAAQTEIAGGSPQAYLPPQQPGVALPPLPTRDVSAAPQVAQVAQQRPAQPAQPAQNSAFGGVDPLILQALQNPFLNEGQRQALQMVARQQMDAVQQQREQQTWQAREEYKRTAERSDPSYQLEQDYKRAQLEALKNKTGKSNLINAGEGNIYDPDTGTWIKAPSAQGQTGDAFRFGGNSVEAQALNGLIESQQLTAGQAQQLAAGKTITDPSTGATMFLTPQGIFRQQGQAPQAPAAQEIDIFAEDGRPSAQPMPAPAPSTQPAPQQPATAAPQPQKPGVSANPGIIPLTEGKPQKLLTESERKNQSLFSVVQPELKVVEDNFDALSDPKNQAYSRLPFSEFATTPEYQKAANSLQTIVSSYLYSVSGATATPDEVRKQTDILTPRPGEAKESIANKKMRIRTMVNAIAKAGSLPNMDDSTAQPRLDDLLKKYGN